MNLKTIPSNLLAEVNQVYNQYKQQAKYLTNDIAQLGGLDNAISLFNTSFTDNPCVTGGACNSLDRAKMIEEEFLLRQLQNAANKDLMKTLEKEEEDLGKQSSKIDGMNANLNNISGNKDGLQALGQMLGALNLQMVTARATSAKIAKTEAIAKLKKDNDDAENKAHFESQNKVSDAFLDLKAIEQADRAASAKESRFIRGN